MNFLKNFFNLWIPCIVVCLTGILRINRYWTSYLSVGREFWGLSSLSLWEFTAEFGWIINNCVIVHTDKRRKWYWYQKCCSFIVPHGKINKLPQGLLCLSTCQHWYLICRLTWSDEKDLFFFGRWLKIVFFFFVTKELEISFFHYVF